MVGEDCSTNEALEDTESADAEVGSEDGEVLVEELVGPANFREHEEDYLEDDEQAVENGPEYTCGLVGYGTSSAKELGRCKGTGRVGTH